LDRAVEEPNHRADNGGRLRERYSGKRRW